ncbi:VgrG protein [Acinetobacter gyllenbergii CIP 110306 = MTCC 11365]|nr:VgrG protein [Acinetobacter gyllenbergii CIP 110306 = MTCC 11365]
MQSSHAVSQLNLGKLSHPKDKAESEDRGEGFELRTDQWGAVRAGEGLLVSTYKQDQGQGEHLDTEETQIQLTSSLNNAQALSEVAKNQQTDEIESVEQLKAFAEYLEKNVASFKKSLLLLNSPAGIGLSSNEDIHVSADGQINQFAGNSINLSTQKNFIGHALNKVSLFAIQGNFNLVAAQGKFSIQAQSSALDVLAKLGVCIASTEDRIEISSPKEVLITGASSQIALNGSGIFPKTGGKFESKAGQHMFMAGESANQMAQLPQAKPLKGALELLKSYGGQDFFQDTSFKVLDSLGKQVLGRLVKNGYAVVTGIAPGPAKVEFERDLRSAWEEKSHFSERDYTWSDEIISGIKAHVQNALDGIGQNMMSQLKTQLFSGQISNLKEMGKHALQDLGQQTIAQFKDQTSHYVLSAISSQLNANLSLDQIMMMKQIGINPKSSVQDG